MSRSRSRTVRSSGRLRTVSLRARVTALSLAVLAAVLLVVGVLTDVLVAAQTRADVRGALTARAAIGQEIAARGATPEIVAELAQAPGVAAVVVAPDGTEYGSGPPRVRHRDGWWRRTGPPGWQHADPLELPVLEQPLPDGSRLVLIAYEGPAVRATQDRLRRTLLVLSAAALVVAGVVTLWTTRVALAPLDTMTVLARSIARGDRGRRLSPDRTDTELGRTAAAFDDMLDALEGAERAARAAEAAARAAADRTRQFVADAAHELRTPLAGVQAAAEAATAPQLAPEERDRLNVLLLHETRRAARLVEDLLALARIDAGIELPRQPVDLLALARAEAERVELLGGTGGITVDGEPVIVTADPERLSQVLANLLDNARRHAPDTPVRVHVSADEVARVVVTDRGPGVPDAHRERVFDRLVRLDEARSGAEDGGAGLGLAIARGIARAHGGELRCVEPSDGVGAAFELTLPR